MRKWAFSYGKVGGIVGKLVELQQIGRTLYGATWVLLVLIAGCSILQYGPLVAGTPWWVLCSLLLIYGLFLHSQLQHGHIVTTFHFYLESVLILLILWLVGSHMAVYLIPLLLLRRAIFVAVARFYCEATAVAVAYLIVGYITPHYHAGLPTPWIYQLGDLYMIGLTVAIAPPVIQMAKALRSEKEKLRLKLNRAQVSYEKATELAARDGLTGLYNYRTFQEHVQRIARKEFAILLIDVDYFKEFNDQYGHLVGDKVLQQLGQVIEDNVRRVDPVFRYGGEEFAVLLEEADREVAVATAERIRIQVANQTIVFNSQEIRGITISVGVSVFSNTEKSTHEIFEQADQALYQAKAKGRNNVVCFCEPSLC